MPREQPPRRHDETSCVSSCISQMKLYLTSWVIFCHVGPNVVMFLSLVAQGPRALVSIPESDITAHSLGVILRKPLAEKT